MSQFLTLFELASGRPIPSENDGPATRTRLMIGGLLGCAGCAALYGLAAGSSDPMLAASDAFKVPMVVVLSMVAAAPAGLLAWKLTGADHRASDLLMGLASGNFAASLVLLVMAPLVALYYHSSSWLGPVLGIAAGSIALLVGFGVGLRAVLSRVAESGHRRAATIPLMVMGLMQLLTLVQLIHVASPILPEVTVFAGGADALVGR